MPHPHSHRRLHITRNIGISANIHVSSHTAPPATTNAPDDELADTVTTVS
jgi:hypothetical protein